MECIIVTEERFGMKNGKEGWKLGSAFLWPPVFIYLTDEEEEGIGYGYYLGSPRVATNESIIVAVTDDTDDMYHPNNEIGFRDASNLNYIETVSSPIPNRRVSIVCGQVGSEIIVTSNSRQMCARHGNDVQRWELMALLAMESP